MMNEHSHHLENKSKYEQNVLHWRVIPICVCMSGHTVDGRFDGTAVLLQPLDPHVLSVKYIPYIKYLLFASDLLYLFYIM